MSMMLCFAIYFALLCHSATCQIRQIAVSVRNTEYLIPDTDSDESTDDIWRNTYFNIDWSNTFTHQTRPLNLDLDDPPPENLDALTLQLSCVINDMRVLSDAGKHNYTVKELQGLQQFAKVTKWLARPYIAVKVDRAFLPGIEKTKLGLTCGILYEVFFQRFWQNSWGNNAEVVEDPYLLSIFYTRLRADIQYRFFLNLETLAQLYGWDLHAGLPIPFEVGCPIEIYNARFLKDQVETCDSDYYATTADNWNAAGTDTNLEKLWARTGADSQKIWWRGRAEGDKFSKFLGRTMSATENFQCSLESRCHLDLDCTQTGSRKALALGTNHLVLQSRWGYFALTALANINDQLSNQYVAIKGAAIRATLDTFNIDDYYPQKNQQFSLRNVISGCGTVFALIGGFTPIASGFVGGASAVVGALGGLLSSEIAQATDPLATQKTFAPKVEEIYAKFVSSLNNATTALFDGGKVGNATIFDLMRNGSWVDSRILSRVSSVETQLKTEILSRSIDALWKTGPSNKTYVLFVDLQDDPSTRAKCLDDTDGPLELRYCDDGGVYYAYNYVEDGNLEGHLDYPWGADKLQGIDIDMRYITEGSAKTYRVAKDPTNPLNPFDFTAENTTGQFVYESVSKDVGLDLQDLAGRYPGSWTLPVCNVSTWGGQWNYNIKNQTGLKLTLETRIGGAVSYPHVSKGSPPCICGDKGDDTKAWVKAAGMYGFQTYYQFCKQQLESKDFVWPSGVDCVNYGFGDDIKQPGVEVCSRTA